MDQCMIKVSENEIKLYDCVRRHRDFQFFKSEKHQFHFVFTKEDHEFGKKFKIQF